MALPLVSSDKVLAALARAGFTVEHISGSHAALKRDTRVTVVVLGKKEIPRGTLKNILKLAGISEAEFRAFLK